MYNSEMDFIPGKNEALVRAHLMRALRDDGASIATIAAYFDYQVWSVEKIIAWHEKLYPVMPEVDETGMPGILNEFRLNRPSQG